MVEVNADLQTIRVTEGLTEDAVCARLHDGEAQFAMHASSQLGALAPSSTAGTMEANPFLLLYCPSQAAWRRRCSCTPAAWQATSNG